MAVRCTSRQMGTGGALNGGAGLNFGTGAAFGLGGGQQQASRDRHTGTRHKRNPSSSNAEQEQRREHPEELRNDGTGFLLPQQSATVTEGF